MDTTISIEQWPVKKLIPNPDNPRRHPRKQIQLIAESIKVFGFNNPILVRETGDIIAGHGRLEAALKLGIDHVPVIVLDHLTDTEAVAYLIADNRTQEASAWDEGLLAQNVRLVAQDEAATLALNAMGFAERQIQAMIGNVGGLGKVDENAVPDTPAAPVSVLGDLWELGGHRVLCGDATDKEAVGQLLGGVEPHLMVTDPPYGVNYDPAWRDEADQAIGKKTGSRAVGRVLNDGQADWRDAWALFPGVVAYVWHAGIFSHVVAESLIVCQFEIRSQIIWAKHRFVFGRGHYHLHHEPCFYAVRKSGTGHWSGSRKESTLWQIEHLKSDTGHGTQKPVECMRRPIQNNSSVGQAIYDPFLGSGTTVIAAETGGRICYGLELDPVYVDVIVKRWQEFTGGIAKHTVSGLSFDEVAEERLSQSD